MTQKQIPHAVYEVNVVYQRPIIDTMFRIQGSLDVFELMQKVIDRNRIDLKEFFWVILLSRAHHVLGVSQIGSGGIDGVVVNNHEVFQLAICANASAIILCHNHPSGNLKPSEKDRQQTKTIREIGDIHSIVVHDHLIVSSEGYYSMADNGLI